MTHQNDMSRSRNQRLQAGKDMSLMYCNRLSEKKLLSGSGTVRSWSGDKIIRDMAVRGGDEIKFLLSRTAIPTWLFRFWLESCLMFDKYSKPIATKTISSGTRASDGCNVSPRDFWRSWRPLFEMVYRNAMLTIVRQCRKFRGLVDVFRKSAVKI